MYNEDEHITFLIDDVNYYSSETSVISFEFLVFLRSYRDLWRSDYIATADRDESFKRTATSMPKIIRRYVDGIASASESPLLRINSGVSRYPLRPLEKYNLNNQIMGYFNEKSRIIDDTVGYACISYLGATPNVMRLAENASLLINQGIEEQLGFIPKSLLNSDRYDREIIQSVLNPSIYIVSFVDLLSDPELATRILGINYTLNRNRSSRLGSL